MRTRKAHIPTLAMPTATDDDSEITPDFLSTFTSSPDLLTVTALTFVLDSTQQSLDSLGFFLPNLTSLSLSTSCIPSLRDFGLSFSHLKILNISRCSLSDLSGVSALSRLEELYAALNNVSDLFPLCSCDFLTVLDLEGNAVNDKGELQYLGFLSRLKELTIVNNPLGVSRDEVLKELPGLEVLDDLPVGRDFTEDASTKPPTRELQPLRPDLDGDEVAIVMSKARKTGPVRPSTARLASPQVRETGRAESPRGMVRQSPLELARSRKKNTTAPVIIAGSRRRPI
jgi:hypothetical protein